MHILELPTFFPPYGGMFCVDQSLALALQGNTVRIAANLNLSMRLTPWLYLGARRKPYMTEVRGIEVLRNDLRGIPFSVRRNTWHWVNTTLRLVDKYVEKFGGPDIIHAHCCQWAGYAAMQSAAKYGVPYVVTEHLSSQIVTREYGRDVYNAWQLPYLRRAYHDAALVIPVSPELVDDLAPFYGTDYKWTSVSNTIDTDFFKYRRRNAMQGRRYRLCCLADFIPRKGYDVLFDALNIYMEKTGERPLLVAAGKFVASDAARRMVEQKGLQDVVELRGEVDKQSVLEILYDSDCLLLATRNEAQGLVLLEAMSTGIPVITTDCVSENVRIEGGCHIVPVDDAGAMADAVARLREKGENDCLEASKEVARRVSPEVIGKRLDQLFKECIQEYKKRQ